MSLYNYGFNTPRLLSNPAYYHKLISCNTFIYISKIAANTNRGWNTYKFGNASIVISYDKESRDADFNNVHFTKGWNEDNAPLITYLKTYRDSQQCIYKNRITDLIQTLKAMKGRINYTTLVRRVDSAIITMMFNIDRRDLALAPKLTAMSRKSTNPSGIGRVTELIKENFSGYYPSRLRIGLSTYTAGLEVDKRPKWLGSIECQKRINDVEIPKTIVNLLGEYQNPLATLNEAFSFIEVETPHNGN